MCTALFGVQRSQRRSSRRLVSCSNLRVLKLKFYSLKLLVQSWGSCLDLIQLLYSKTAYLYPIGIPCVQSAGGYYRFSITRCLPDAIINYLEYVSPRNSSTNSNHTPFNQSVFAKAIENIDKKNILSRFIPDCLKGKNILIESSNINIKEGRAKTVKFKDDVNGLAVEEKREVADLAYISLSLIKYIKGLSQFILKETGDCCEFISKKNTLDMIRDINDEYLNYRFKELVRWTLD